MEWSKLYPQAGQPTAEQISTYIGGGLWGVLTAHIEETYRASPKVEYSRCGMAPGWNVKYRKGGKALCTLYPAEGYFTCLVSVPERLQNEAEFTLLACTEYTRGIYAGVRPYAGGLWLMLDVKDAAVLEDVKRLLELRTRVA